MSLSYETWLTDLENAISAHIVDTLGDAGIDVEISIDKEIVLPFKKPVISLANISEERENTGGMNVVDDTQQGYWHTVDYFMTINTDNGTGRAKNRNKIWSLLDTITFGQQLHLLKNTIDGISITIEGRGNADGPSGPTVWYQKQGMLSVRCLVAFTSVTI